jgi:hypothetical protein
MLIGEGAVVMDVPGMTPQRLSSPTMALVAGANGGSRLVRSDCTTSRLYAEVAMPGLKWYDARIELMRRSTDELAETAVERGFTPCAGATARIVGARSARVDAAVATRERELRDAREMPEIATHVSLL